MKKPFCNLIIIATFLFVADSFFFSGPLYSRERSLYKLAKEAEQLFKRGDYEATEAKCKQAIKVDPEFFYPYNLLGTIYADRGKFKKAIYYFEKSVNAKEGQPEIHNYIAYLYNGRHKFDKAIAHMEKGLEYDPKNFNLNYNLGITYLLGKNDPEKAVVFFEIALLQRPDYERLLYISGVTHIFAGKESIVLEYITKLRQLKDEYLASRLEELLKDRRQGKDIKYDEIIRDYTGKPKKKKETEEQEQETDQEASVNVSQESSTQVKGSGTITIERRYRKK